MDAGIIIQVVLLLVGFVFLIKGSDFFVDGSSSIASLLKIPTYWRVFSSIGIKEASVTSSNIAKSSASKK